MAAVLYDVVEDVICCAWFWTLGGNHDDQNRSTI